MGWATPGGRWRACWRARECRRRRRRVRRCCCCCCHRRTSTTTVVTARCRCRHRNTNRLPSTDAIHCSTPPSNADAKSFAMLLWPRVKLSARRRYAASKRSSVACRTPRADRRSIAPSTHGMSAANTDVRVIHFEPLGWHLVICVDRVKQSNRLHKRPQSSRTQQSPHSVGRKSLPIGSPTRAPCASHVGNWRGASGYTRHSALWWLGTDPRPSRRCARWRA